MSRFRQAVNAEMSGIRFTPGTVRADSDNRKVKRKVPFSTVLVFAVILTAAVAAAITVSDLIHKKMEPVADMQLPSAEASWQAWDLNTKVKLVGLITDWDLEPDPQKLAAVNDPGLSDAEREQAADEIIFAVFTEKELTLIAEEHPDVEQQEEYPAPSLYTVYETLWLKESPDSDPSEIRAAFDVWEAGTSEKVSAQTAPITYASDEDEVRALFEENMSEVLSMSRSERAAAVIAVTQVEGYPLWQVTMTVSGKDLRDSTRQTLGTGSVLSPEVWNEATDTYTYTVLYEETVDGLKRVPDARSVAEYEYSRLYESIAWPGSEADVHGIYHRFLTASAADKAAFSLRYRPVAEAWYASHQEFAALLEKTWRERSKYDTLYIVTRHIYGVSPESALQEPDIRYLAAEAYAGLYGSVSVQALLGEQFEMYVWYDITDPSAPVWKVTVRACADTNPTGYMNAETRHMVFSPDGQLLRDGGDPLMIAGVTSDPAPSVTAPLAEEDRIEFD